MTVLNAFILGLVQGLTEFLPISSSAHLAIFSKLLGGADINGGLTFDILVHGGTLLAVFIVYHKDIWLLIKEFFSLFLELPNININKTPQRRLLIMLMVATIPAMIIGLLFKDLVEHISANMLWLVGIFLMITSFMLYISDKVTVGKKDESTITYRNALVVGFFQSMAVLPGLSRSGFTIVSGLLSRFSKEFAVKFSFLLSIPIILGALVLDLADTLKYGTDVTLLNGLVGFFTAALAGYISIRVLLNLISKNKLGGFAAYCLIAGLAAIVVSL